MEAKPARQDEHAETPIMEDTVIAHTPLEAGDNGSGSQRNREDAARTQDTSSDVPSLLDTKLWDEHPVYNPPLSASIREPLGPDLQPYAHTSGPASYTSRYPTVCHHAPHHAHNDDDHHHPRYTGGMEGPVSGDPSMASTSRLTLADFRRSEGPALRAQKLHALWRSLPTLPEPSERPTPTQMVKLPGQDTIGILSPERAERLSRLYLEELSRRVNMQERPEARLWGGADDLTEPEQQQQQQQQAQQQQQQQQQKKSGKGIAWKDFRKFLWDQEKELWDIFHDLDRDGDGKLDVAEMRNALQRSGIEMTDSGLRDFVSFLASGATTPPSTQQQRKDATYITFAEFRDFLILLPRKASVQEIYKFYQVKKRFPDGRGAARVNMDGDLSVSFPKSTASNANSSSTSSSSSPKSPEELANCRESEASLVDGHEDCASSGRSLVDHSNQIVQEEDEDTEDHMEFNRHVAWKFLLAGGVAGAVSRTATAPFDRLKVYLITKTDTPQEVKRPPDVLHSATVKEATKKTLKFSRKGFGHLSEAVARIYRDGGGIRAFWVGNGLNVTKIFPESAIKFFSYEYSKRLFAQYWDCVPEQTDISGTSRFISGGIGGITSQMTIYPVETLKTQLQSRIGRKVDGGSALRETARAMWQSGGIRAYYRGLTLGLVGVFPYSAIDMSTFEALKIAYCKSFDLEEPQVLAVLSFGALSGSIGATSVYPINLLRTRLQASGSPGHPTVYTGFVDVANQTLAREGWQGLYKGLVPTLAKVVPAVSISYVVYEHCKRTLHIA